MKRKALILSFILCGVYFFICQWLNSKKPEVQSSQGLWSENIILAQKFLYEKPDEKYNCILGSSLSSLFCVDSLPKNVQLLGLKGLGVYDGLNLLRLKPTLPDTLFIEINVLHRQPKQEFIEKVGSTPIELALKRNLLFLQEKYIPIGLSVSIVENSLKNMKAPATAIANPDSGFSENKLPFQHSFYGLSLSDQEKICIDSVCQILKRMEKKNVKIFFFEMPIHCSLADTKLPRAIKERVAQNYYPASYSSMPSENCKDYETSDGIHLTKASGKKYSSVFRKKISAL